MPKILIMTSVVGGGHVFRDLAIAQELKKILPSGYEIIFASGGNAYEMLQEEGVRVEKISALDFPVHLGTANFFKFYFVMLWSEYHQILDLRKLIRKYSPALVVLDEYFFLTDYCRLRGIPVVFICDFVGIPHCSFFSNPVRSLMERFFDVILTRWLARRADRWIFTGDGDHVSREDWRVRARNVGIMTVEPITKFQYTPPPTRHEARQKLGFDENDKVVMVTVGCTGAGEYLLKAANEATPLLTNKVPGLRMELICGKGIDSGPLRRTANPGVHVHDYVRNFQEFVAASDAAVLQCGLTSMLTLGLLSWLARNTADAIARRAIILAFLVFDAAGVIISLLGTLSRVMSPLGWQVVVIYLLLCLGFGYFHFAKPDFA
jgi:UDP-N-acetylglucosamine:LPS N-acetylglucosamine transferase